MISFWIHSRLTAAALVAGAVVALATGCATNSTSGVLRGKTLPTGGKPIAEEVFVAAEGAPKEARVGSIGANYCPLPLVKHKRRFEVGADRRTAESAKVSYYGLGVRHFNLPLASYYGHHNYERGTAEPVGSITRGSHPFLAWAKTTGKPDPDFEIKAGGVPLLYEWGRERADAWYLEEAQNGIDLHRTQSFWRSVWSIGPAARRIQDSQDTPKGRYESRERYFMPLLIGELGALLYTDYSQNYKEPGRTTAIRGSGPLFGYPLYFRAVVNDDAKAADAEAKTEATPVRRGYYKLLLGGIVWYHRSAEYGGEVKERARGPLWALFGSGVNDGQPVTYILRIPFKKSQPKAAEAPATSEAPATN